MTRPPQAHRGATLVEALIAFAIFSTGMLALLRGQAAMQAQQDLARDIALATALAETELERLQSQAWHQLPPDGHDTQTQPARAGQPTAFTIKRQFATQPPGWRTIAISIHWQDLSLSPRHLQWQSARAFEIDGWGAGLLTKRPDATAP